MGNDNGDKLDPQWVRQALTFVAGAVGFVCMFACGIYVDQGWWGLAAATGIGSLAGIGTCIVLATREQ